MVCFFYLTLIPLSIKLFVDLYAFDVFLLPLYRLPSMLYTAPNPKLLLLLQILLLSPIEETCIDIWMKSFGGPSGSFTIETRLPLLRGYPNIELDRLLAVYLD